MRQISLAGISGQWAVNYKAVIEEAINAQDYTMIPTKLLCADGIRAVTKASRPRLLTLQP